MAQGQKNLPFVHLRLHSSYSLLESTLRIDDIVRLAREAKMPAVALTDNANLYGALEFSERLAAEGIQPIIGCTLPVFTGRVAGETEQRGRLPVLAFLARTKTGYRHLMQLSRLAHDPERPAKGTPYIGLSDLAERAEGLACLTGGVNGLLAQTLLAGQQQEANHILDELQEFFPRHLYIEIQRHGLESEKRAEAGLLRLADERKLPLVAANEPYYAAAADFPAQDTLLCIAHGHKISDQRRERRTGEHWFKTGEDMAALFADLPAALDNTALLARLCTFYPESTEPELPYFLPGGPKAEAEELRRQAATGLEKRLTSGISLAVPEQEYRARLQQELDVITGMKYSGYFLIVADFVQWAVKQGIPVGPGRGSGAGSLVSYALGITGLDPLRFNLFFERFLNPERISMPDFDIDFCQDRRDEVISYVRDRYGRDKVANIITFGALKARAVLRDAGRVLSLPYGQVDRLCKFVPNNPADPVELAVAIEREPALKKERDEKPEIANLFKTSSAIEGLYRHASTHAAGVVIGSRPLEETIPLTYDPKSGAGITQFSMHWVERAGLVKFDFLGLKTLTVLRHTAELLAKRGIEVSDETIPLDDKKTYELLSSGETTGLFQLESAGVRDALRRMRPDRFEDIIALVALYRPGPMDNIPRYIACKNGKERPDYLYPSLEPVLKETFGVIIYQEQVMQIAQILSGFTPARADILRRAMGKKIVREMRSQKKHFVEGAVANNVPRHKATEIFDLVARFAGYGFNKSHAAAYALLAVRTAWLKAHYPVEFFAALMSSDIANPEKIGHLRREAVRLGVETTTPDINKSQVMFAVEDGQIIYALGAIRNVGLSAAAAIVKAREETGGAFKSIYDIARYTQPRFLNKRVIENLAMTGAFDALEPNRRQIFANSETVLRSGSRQREERQSGQTALFTGSQEAKTILPEIEPWPEAVKLEKEFEAAGQFLSGHPLESLRGKITRAGAIEARQLEDAGEGEVSLAGVVTAVNRRVSRRGNPFAFVTCSDTTGAYEVMVFSDVLSAQSDLLEAGKLVFINAEIQSQDSGERRIRVSSITPLRQALTRVRAPARSRREISSPTSLAHSSPKRQMLRIFLAPDAAPAELKPYLSRGGGAAVRLVVPPRNGRESIEIALPADFSLGEEERRKLADMPAILRIEAA